MSNSNEKPRARVIEGEYVAIDGLQSTITNMGNPNRDKAASTVYTNTALGDTELENGYRFGWIIRKIVDLPVNDCLRKWRDWTGESTLVAKIKSEEKRLKVQLNVIKAQKQARLWGGAAIFINTGDENVEKPLDIEKIKAGGIESLTVFNRKELTADKLENDPFSPNFGKPEFFNMTAQGGMKSDVKIHHSRLVIFVGSEHPNPWMQTGVNFGWGDSVVQTVSQAAKHADSTSAGIAALVFEANVDVFAVPDFMASMGDKDYEKKIIDRFILAAKGKGISGTLVHDAEEVYDRKAIDFNNLPDVLQKFLLIVSAAANIPLTRFLGEQSKGLGDKGEGDMRNYYDDIATKQTLEIQPSMLNLDECLIRSSLGDRPEEIEYEWTPLQQMSEIQIAEAGNKTADTVKKLLETNLYDPEALESAATAQLVQLKAFPALDTLVAEHARDFDADREFELEVRANIGATAGETETTDAAPRTLYIHRPVKNAQAIIDWAKSQGIEQTLAADDLHVTIAFSSEMLDWMSLGQAWESEIKIPEGGARLVETFGGGATVLLFKATELEWRHKEVLRNGGSYDYDEYQPHITITYGDTPLLKDIDPYLGEIILGPEIFQEIDLDWKNQVTES